MRQPISGFLSGTMAAMVDAAKCHFNNVSWINMTELLSA